MAAHTADLLDDLALFQTFTYPELKSISEHLQKRSFTKGTTIFHEGEAGTFMFILVEGKVSIYKGGEHGHQLMSHESKGRIVGEMALLDHEKRSATCVAESDCALLLMKQENLKDLAAAYPALGYKFMFCLAQLLSRRLRRTTALMADYLTD